jgi:hypothetical protein
MLQIKGCLLIKYPYNLFFILNLRSQWIGLLVRRAPGLLLLHRFNRKMRTLQLLEVVKTKSSVLVDTPYCGHINRLHFAVHAKAGLR